MVRCQVLLIGGDIIGQRRTCKWNIFFTGASYRAQFLKGRLVLDPGFFFFPAAKTFLRIIFSVIFNTIQSSQNELHWIYCFKSFHSWIKLRTNPVKAFNGTCVLLTSITFPVIWSSVLISVTREWRYCGLVYFLINNIELKCSFVRCRKYHKSWSKGAAELHISIDLLCGTTAAELHNSVNLLCGITAAELNPLWCMHQ